MKKNDEKIAQLEARVQNLTDVLEKRRKKNEQTVESNVSGSKANSYKSGNGLMRSDSF